MLELQEETGVFLPLSFIEYTTVLPVLHRVIAYKAFDGAFNQRNLAGGQPFHADHGTDLLDFHSQSFFHTIQRICKRQQCGYLIIRHLIKFFHKLNFDRRQWGI